MHQVALTVGVFDMLHEGHVNLLSEMRNCAEQVHVIVHDDYSTYQNKGRFPIQNLQHRISNVQHFADVVWRTTTADPTITISAVLAHNYSTIYVRGDDWEDFPGKPFLVEQLVPIKYISYTKGISSSERRDEL